MLNAKTYKNKYGQFHKLRIYIRKTFNQKCISQSLNYYQHAA